MLKERISIERKKAVLLTVDFSGKTEEYALAWLKLTNNAREYSNMIWKISNDRGNKVYVICNPKSAEAVREFCTGIMQFYHEEDDQIYSIGKVIDGQEITVGVPVYEYESTCKGDDPRWEDDIDKAVTWWIDVEE